MRTDRMLSVVAKALGRKIGKHPPIVEGLYSTATACGCRQYASALRSVVENARAPRITLREKVDSTLGPVRPIADIIGQLSAEQRVSVETQQVTQEYEHYFHSLPLHRLRPGTPVVEIARRFREQLPMAIATGSDRIS